jgi:CRISPR type I-E-associated protein CasB/Cse2
MSDNAKVDLLVMDAKTRALLRRTDPWEVRGAYDWVRRAKTRANLSTVEDSRLMTLTPMVAEVREDLGEPLGKSLRRAGVSELRVRRLLASESGPDVMEQLTKMIRVLRRSVGIVDLIETAVFWGDRRRRQLARDYFGQADGDEI